MIVCIRTERELAGKTLCGKDVAPGKEPLTQFREFFRMVPRDSMKERYCPDCWCAEMGDDEDSR